MKRHHPKRIFYFGVAGGSAALVQMFSAWAFHECFINIPNWLLVALSLLFSKTINFIFNRNLAFKEHRAESWKKQLAKYTAGSSLASTVNYFTSLSLMEYSVFFDNNPQWAAGIAIIFGALLNYMMSVYFIFTGDKASKSPASSKAR